MKKILIIAFAVFATVNGYAQNTKTCGCKKKATPGVTVQHKHYTRVNTRTYGVAKNKTAPPLFTNRIHNTLAEEVPHAYHGNDVWRYEYATKIGTPERLDVNTEGNYTGNYPKPAIQDTRVTKDDLNKGRIHNGTDLCLWDCPSR